jgi:N-glycosylase/DNA lyase
VQSLVRRVQAVDSDTKQLIDKRWGEFVAKRHESENVWFTEMCFCILTANTSAEMGLRVQKNMGYDGFAKIPADKLSKALKKAGSRFYNTRAKYISAARKYNGSLKKRINAARGQTEAREWLVKNIKGLGYKESSHFLRNVGYGDLAILDKHVINILHENGLIEEFKTMNKKRYIAMEQILRHISDSLKMPLGKLDLYLWYFKTGKVLK